jgi:aminocarboxymuconate-semialdehyde decarboxylase
MTGVKLMKIDAYTHVVPERYKDALYAAIPPQVPIRNIIDALPTLHDMDHRFRIMDKFGDLKQVITMGIPPMEEIAPPDKAADLARLANDELAELLNKHPDRFVAAAASLPMNNMDAALEEVDRAVNDLGFKGVQISTPINDKPLDSPEFVPLYEKMAQYDLPIWIHPVRPMTYADYRTEEMSQYMIFITFGWPYETSVAMARLVFSGLLETYPNLKFITHHCGAMIPFFQQRIECVHDNAKLQQREDFAEGLSMPPIEYFKKFYFDTAINGNPSGLMCGHAFCGTDHMLFATDMPYDNELGARFTRQTVDAIEQMDIPELEKKKIYADNIIGLLQLNI